MGKYTVILTPEATDELRVWHKLGTEATLRKIEKIFDELSEHPTTGTGKPERLKGDLSGKKHWGRHSYRAISSRTGRIAKVFAEKQLPILKTLQVV